MAGLQPRLSERSQELKSNVADPGSTKMATGKGVVQGHAAQAAVDRAHQIIVAAEVTGSGSEQRMLRPMKSQPMVREQHFDLLALSPRFPVLRRVGRFASGVAGRRR